MIRTKKDYERLSHKQRVELKEFLSSLPVGFSCSYNRRGCGGPLFTYTREGGPGEGGSP